MVKQVEIIQRPAKKRGNNRVDRKYFAVKRTISWGISLILVCSLMFAPAVDSFATGGDTATEATTESGSSTETTTENPGNGAVDASVQKAREDAKEASNNLKSAQEILKGLKSARNSLEDYVIELDKALNEIQIEISHLEQNQKELEKSIKETKKTLKVAKKAQSEQYEAMKQRIQMVYESGNKTYLDILLTATSMTDMLNKTEYVSQVSLYDYNVLKELKAAKEQVANLKQKLDKDLATNERLQEDVNKQKSTMEELIEEKSMQIAQYDGSIAGQEEEVQKYMQAKAEAEGIIAAAEQLASSSATSIYTGGVFMWPVPGYNKITSYFGGRYAPVAGASSNHKGIDIACDSGASVVAAAAGTVIVATYNSAEGNYVCIDHGGGVVTVYMHNSSLLVSAGETVSAGQPIALAGSTGISSGPHCHFGVRVDGIYVNPLDYLQ